MDQSSDEQQSNDPYGERNIRSPSQQRFSISQNIQRQHPSQQLSQMQQSPINRPPQILSKGQFQTPIQGGSQQDQGSQQRNSMIRQSFLSDDFQMEEEQEDIVDKYNQILDLILDKLNSTPIGAIDLIEEMMEEYKQEKLRTVNNSGNLDNELIMMIQQAAKSLDDSLTSNTIRVMLSQARKEWQTEDDVGKKVLLDLSEEQSAFGQYLLTILAEPTDSWKMALENQQFVRLPETLMKWLIDESPFKFLMKCLLLHQDATYSQFISDRIWNTVVSDQIQELDKKQLIKNVGWMLELSQKSQTYLRDFLNRGLLSLLMFVFMQRLYDSTEYVEHITIFLYQLLELEIPNLLIEIQKSGLMIVYTQNIKEVQFTEEGYQYLQRLQLSISILYKDELRGMLSQIDWYQVILLKLFAQDTNEKISLLAQKELRQWVQSDDCHHFKDILIFRYDYLDPQFQIRLDKIMEK